MLCQGFYDEDVYEIIMLWQFFGTTRNIVLWEIMLQKNCVRQGNAVLKLTHRERFL